MKHDAEDTQRTRSFLFLVLAAIAARKEGHNEVVYISENGQLAMHLPLTPGRIGAFSTHTALPDFLVDMESFLSTVLDVPIKIENPYIHFTKAEVVRNIITTHADTIPISNSCWRNARLAAHCGECIPCYIRRIAIEYWQSDPTTYERDPWSENISSLGPEDTGRRNIVDLTEFILRIEQSSEEEIMSEWPELYSNNVNALEVIGMYRRFTHEARMVLGQYPNLSALLS